MDWTKEELQEMVFMSGTNGGWARFAQFLNLPKEQVDKLRKEHGLLSSCDYVRSLSVDIITKKVMESGSFERTAKSWGVSASFLRVLLRKHYEKNPLVVEVVEQPLSMVEGVVKEAMERYLSVRLAARMLSRKYGDEWTESKVRAVAKAEKFDLTRCIDGHDTGYNSSFGRRAERAFEELRGANIEEDCNKTQGPSAPFDFVDIEFGKVNVKASKAFRRKSNGRSNYWKFSTQGFDKADNTALMLYNAEGKELLYWSVKPTAPLIEVSTIIIDENPTLFELWGISQVTCQNSH